MKIYLVTSSSLHMGAVLKSDCEYAMLSYYSFISSDKRNFYQKMWGIEVRQDLDIKTRGLLKQFKSVMVDSGAFSYMSGTETKVKKKDIDKFVKGYGQWLRDNRDYYDFFIEMDLDILLPIEIIEEYRGFLEKCAGKKCVPVWHISRGLDYWEKMIRDYNYVAIGGMVSRETTNFEKYVPFLIDIAHKKDCKVHGLGYTKTKLLKYIPWDSVDSATWVYGGKSGVFSHFSGRECLSLNLKNFNKGSNINYIKFFEINAKAWNSYSKYIEGYWARQKEEMSVKDKND